MYDLKVLVLAHYHMEAFKKRAAHFGVNLPSMFLNIYF